MQVADYADADLRWRFHMEAALFWIHTGIPGAESGAMFHVKQCQNTETGYFRDKES